MAENINEIEYKPQEPNELLMKLITEFDKLAQKNQQLISENEKLAKEVIELNRIVTEEVPKQIQAEVSTLASESGKAMQAIVDNLAALKQQQPQQTAAPQGIGSSILDIIKPLIEKFTNAQPANPILQLDENINLMGRRIMAMTYQKTLKDLSVKLDIPEIANATEHIVVEP